MRVTDGERCRVNGLGLFWGELRPNPGRCAMLPPSIRPTLYPRSGQGIPTCYAWRRFKSVMPKTEQLPLHKRNFRPNKDASRPWLLAIGSHSATQTCRFRLGNTQCQADLDSSFETRSSKNKLRASPSARKKRRSTGPHVFPWR